MIATEKSLPSDIEDHDLVDERPKDDARLHGKHLEMPLPDIAPPADQNDPGADVAERYMKWKSAFLESAQRTLHRMGMTKARVIDCRALRTWNVSLQDSGPARSPQRDRDDGLWAEVRKKYSSLIDQTNADEHDYIILVEYGSGGEPMPMVIRKVGRSSLQS